MTKVLSGTFFSVKINPSVLSGGQTMFLNNLEYFSSAVSYKLIYTLMLRYL